MNMGHCLKTGQGIEPTGHRAHRGQRIDKMCPALPGSCIPCMPRSITFPKPGCSKARLHTITSESFTQPLLNNLPPCRQNGSTVSPNIVGLVHNLQSNAQLPRAGRTTRLGHLPKLRRALAGIEKVANGRVCQKSKGTYWILDSQGKSKAGKYEGQDASVQGLELGRGSMWLACVLEVWVKHYRCHTFPDCWEPETQSINAVLCKSALPLARNIFSKYPNILRGWEITACVWEKNKWKCNFLCLEFFPLHPLGTGKIPPLF